LEGNIRGIKKRKERGEKGGEKVEISGPSFYARLSFYHEDGSGKFLRNVCVILLG
jgi:hypothetical protein